LSEITKHNFYLVTFTLPHTIIKPRLRCVSDFLKANFSVLSEKKKTNMNII